jgi:hypothetical protein
MLLASSISRPSVSRTGAPDPFGSVAGSNDTQREQAHQPEAPTAPPDGCIVADTGLIAALPLWLFAKPEWKS